MEFLSISKNFVRITFMFALFCVAWSSQEKLQFRIYATDVIKFRNLAQTCEKETGVPASFLKNVIDGTLPNDEKHSSFQYCVAFNGDVIEEDGHFSVAKMTSMGDVLSGTKEDYEKIIRDCNKNTKEDKLLTMRAAASCLYDNIAFTIEKTN